MIVICYLQIKIKTNNLKFLKSHSTSICQSSKHNIFMFMYN